MSKFLCLFALYFIAYIATAHANPGNTHVEVFKSFTTIQCQYPSKEKILSELKSRLNNAEIQVYKSRVEVNGFDFPQTCGKTNKSFVVFTISKSQLSLSQNLGYHPYVPRS